MKKISSLIFFILIFVYANAQTPFQIAIGTTADEQCSGGFMTKDKGYFLWGHYGNAGYIIKLNKLRQIQWEKQIAFATLINIYDATETSDGSFLLAGHKYNAGNDDYFGSVAMKLNKNGEQIWTDYGTAFTENNYSNVIQTKDGNYVFCGISAFGTSDINYQIYVTKTDTAGNVIWSEVLTQTHLYFYGNDICEASDGSLYIASESVNNVAHRDSGTVIKLTSAGGLLWAKSYSATDKVTGYGYKGFSQVKPAPDGGVYVSGWGKTATFPNGAFGIMKLDGDGNTQWNRFMSEPTGSLYSGGSLALVQNKFILACSNYKSGNGLNYTNLHVSMLNTSGKFIRRQIIDGNYGGGDIRLTPFGDASITGTISSAGNGSNDFFIARSNNTSGFCNASDTGTTLIDTTMPATFSLATTVTSNSLPYRASYTTTNFPNANIAVLCGTQVLADKISGIKNTVSALSVSVFPNPVTNYLVIKLHNNSSPKITITINDINGKKADAKDYNTWPGDFSLKYDMSRYKAGVYIITINTDKEIKTLKVIKQ